MDQQCIPPGLPSPSGYHLSVVTLLQKQVIFGVNDVIFRHVPFFSEYFGQLAATTGMQDTHLMIFIVLINYR